MKLFNNKGIIHFSGKPVVKLQRIRVRYLHPKQSIGLVTYMKTMKKMPKCRHVTSLSFQTLKNLRFKKCMFGFINGHLPASKIIWDSITLRKIEPFPRVVLRVPTPSWGYLKIVLDSWVLWRSKASANSLPRGGFAHKEIGWICELVGKLSPRTISTNSSSFWIFVQFPAVQPAKESVTSRWFHVFFHNPQGPRAWQGHAVVVEVLIASEV